MSELVEPKFNEEQMEAIFKVLEDKEVEKEVKLSLILEMAYSGNVSLAKAKELCTETGLFSDHWVVVEAKATEVFSQYMTKQK